MMRVVVFLIAVGVLALGAAWLADRPDDVIVIWQGLRIKTPLWVLAAAILVAMAIVVFLWIIVRAFFGSPFMLRRHLDRRRGERAYEAISKGLIAVGSGDLVAARAHAAEVKRLAPSEPLALLLHAQSAQLAGDREGADAAFQAMASRADTKALGLHGLFVEARRRDDHSSAHAFAEEAARVNPSLGWASKAVLELRCAIGDWAGALALLEGNKRTLDKENYRRQRAVLLTARAQSAEDTDRDNAKAFALEAAKLAPTFVPAASLAGRMLAEAGELRKATRVVEKAWKANPHPDLAQVIADLRFGDAARDRLKRIEGFAKKVPGNIEGALALARAAIEAQDFGKARAALASFLAVPTKRVALLMAELERAEHNNEGRAREWIARALNAAPDPTWTADGHVSDRWLPASPSGRLDAFTWRVPLSGVENKAPVIESGPPPADAPAVVDSSKPQAEVSSSEPLKPPTLSEIAAGSAPARRRDRSAQPKPDAVIPLVHAPDDPGPDATDESEPQAEPPSGSGWRSIFQ